MKNRYEFKRIVKEIENVKKDFVVCGIFTNSDLAWENSDGGIRKIDRGFKHGIEVWYDRNKANPNYYLIVNDPLFKKFVKKNININVNGMQRCNGSWYKYGKKCEFIG